jgi:hypothetical protein
MAVAEKNDSWLNYLALTTVILAVCATLSTFKGGGYSTRSVMSQSQASDVWAFYQAKAIKTYIYQMQVESLELKVLELPQSISGDVVKTYKERIADYKMKMEKHEQEKAALQQKAKQLEELRDEFQKHSQIFGMAVIFLQIAILLSSIAGLLKKKMVWYGGMATGLIGILYFVDGFFLFL